MKDNSIIIVAAGLVVASIILTGSISSNLSPVNAPARPASLLAADNTNGNTQSLGMLAADNTNGNTQSLGMLAADNTNGNTQSLGLLAVNK